MFFIFFTLKRFRRVIVGTEKNIMANKMKESILAVVKNREKDLLAKKPDAKPLLPKPDPPKPAQPTQEPKEPADETREVVPRPLFEATEIPIAPVPVSSGRDNSASYWSDGPSSDSDVIYDVSEPPASSSRRREPYYHDNVNPNVAEEIEDPLDFNSDSATPLEVEEPYLTSPSLSPRREPRRGRNRPRVGHQVLPFVIFCRKKFVLKKNKHDRGRYTYDEPSPRNYADPRQNSREDYLRNLQNESERSAPAYDLETPSFAPIDPQPDVQTDRGAQNQSRRDYASYGGSRRPSRRGEDFYVAQEIVEDDEVDDVTRGMQGMALSAPARADRPRRHDWGAESDLYGQYPREPRRRRRDRDPGYYDDTRRNYRDRYSPPYGKAFFFFVQYFFSLFFVFAENNGLTHFCGVGPDIDKTRSHSNTPEGLP